MVWESVVARRLAWREDLSLLDGFLISCRRAVYSNEPRVLAPTSQWVGHSARVSVCVYVWVIADSWKQGEKTSLNRDSIHNCQSWRTDHIYGCNDSNGHQTDRQPGTTHWPDQQLDQVRVGVADIARASAASSRAAAAAAAIGIKSVAMRHLQ